MHSACRSRYDRSTAVSVIESFVENVAHRVARGPNGDEVLNVGRYDRRGNSRRVCPTGKRHGTGLPNDVAYGQRVAECIDRLAFVKDSLRDLEKGETSPI